MSKSETNHFETDVLKIVLAVGLIRATIELLTNPINAGLIDLALDFGYLLIFLFGIAIVLLRIDKRILLAGFYLPLVLLLSLTFFERGGLSASSENNVYAGILIIGITLRGKIPARLILLLLVLTLVALVAAHFFHPNAQDLDLYKKSTFNFTFMSVGTIALIYFAKRNFDKKRIRLLNAQLRLMELNKGIQIKKKKIEEQNQELRGLNKHLETKIQKQIVQLEQQKEVMNEYLKITLSELLTNHRNMKKSLDKVSVQSEMDRMIVSSAGRLEQEINSLKQKIER